MSIYDNIPDRLEALELSFEKYAEEREMPNGNWLCDCGKIFNPDEEGGPSSNNPYARPICGECLGRKYGGRI